MIGQLTISRPFDLKRTLDCGQGHRWRPETDDKGKPTGWYNSVLCSRLIRISQPAGRNTPVQYEYGTAKEQSEIEDKLRWQFRLNDDVKAIYASLSRDPTMAGLVRRYFGLRVMRVDPWESLVFFILAAHRTIKFAQDKMEEIAAKFEGPDLGGGRRPFPRPQAVSGDCGIARLRKANVGDDKARYITKAAQDTQGWNWDGLAYPRARKDAAIDLLRSLDGLKVLGKRNEEAKTANCVALFGLGT